MVRSIEDQADGHGNPVHSAPSAAAPIGIAARAGMMALSCDTIAV